MRGRRAVAAGLALAAVAAAASPAFAHSGGSTGYASIAIGHGSIRYSLTLWPPALPPAVAEELQRARAGRTPSRDRLLGVIRDKVTLDAPGSGSRGTGSFFLLGVEHILSGYDHLLFLLGLLLRGGGWLSLAKIITAFTLAHSVTLALAVLNVVVVPDRLVEAVIALSIAFVAAENLFLNPVASRRWLVSFCFGLVHGFGFSSALRELGLPAQGLLFSLFGFNAGVEAGQALVVAVVLPLIVVLRRSRWEERMVWSSSLAILLVGLVLFVERAFL